jgi:hypothetical protein
MKFIVEKQFINGEISGNPEYSKLWVVGMEYNGDQAQVLLDAGLIKAVMEDHDVPPMEGGEAALAAELDEEAAGADEPAAKRKGSKKKG